RPVLGSVLDGLRGERGAEARHDGDRAAGQLLLVDAQHAELLVVPEVWALAGVDVHRHSRDALTGDPADVRAEPGLVDLAVPGQRQHGGGSDALEIDRAHARLLAQIAFGARSVMDVSTAFPYTLGSPRTATCVRLAYGSAHKTSRWPASRCSPSWTARRPG